MKFKIGDIIKLKDDVSNFYFPESIMGETIEQIDRVEIIGFNSMTDCFNIKHTSIERYIKNDGLFCNFYDEYDEDTLDNYFEVCDEEIESKRELVRQSMNTEECRDALRSAYIGKSLQKIKKDTTAKPTTFNLFKPSTW